MLVVSTGRGSVVSDRSLAIAGHLQQVRAHGVQAMVILHASIRVEVLQQLQAGGRTVDHRRSDRVIERDHRVV